jgi:hypothetical protein
LAATSKVENSAQGCQLKFVHVYACKGAYRLFTGQRERERKRERERLRKRERERGRERESEKEGERKIEKDRER